MTAPKIVMPSQIVMRATASLIGYARNSRTHDERQIDVLCKSITEYGFTNPILIDGDRGVIAGHGRIMAAEKLGLVEVPCIELRHLTNEQKRAYLIADNAIGTMSGWNEALLAQELADLSGVGIEATDLGLDAAEVDRLMETLGVDFGKSEGDPDAVPEAPVVPTSKLGDVWLLGRHRVMCGDSTDRAQVERLMDGAPFQLVVLDPPYECSDQVWRDWIHDPSIVFGQVRHLRVVPPELWRFERVVVKKHTHRSATVQVRHMHAFVAQVGSIKTLPADKKATLDSVVHQELDTQHDHQKPVSLLVEHMTHWSPPWRVVMDPFGGSGSTCIAAERLGKSALTMELDPAYVDVIVRRWQDFTGQAATLDADGRTFAEIAEARRA